MNQPIVGHPLLLPFNGTHPILSHPFNCELINKNTDALNKITNKIEVCIHQIQALNHAIANDPKFEIALKREKEIIENCQRELNVKMSFIQDICWKVLKFPVKYFTYFKQERFQQEETFENCGYQFLSTIFNYEKLRSIFYNKILVFLSITDHLDLKLEIKDVQERENDLLSSNRKKSNPRKEWKPITHQTVSSDSPLVSTVEPPFDRLANQSVEEESKNQPCSNQSTLLGITSFCLGIALTISNLVFCLFNLQRLFQNSKKKDKPLSRMTNNLESHRKPQFNSYVEESRRYFFPDTEDRQEETTKCLVNRHQYDDPTFLPTFLLVEESNQPHYQVPKECPIIYQVPRSCPPEAIDRQSSHYVNAQDVISIRRQSPSPLLLRSFLTPTTQEGKMNNPDCSETMPTEETA